MFVSMLDQYTQRRIEISWKEFERQYLTDEKQPTDFVINLIFPYDIIGSLEDKMNDYRRAGVKTVWLIYIKQKIVHVYTGKRLEYMKVHRGNMVCSAICGERKVSINTAVIFEAIGAIGVEEVG